MSARNIPRPSFAWWAILCLVGLDYFSSLAYLPSIAIGQMGWLAPIGAIGVVLITLLAAVPVYWYVVGRSPHGKGGIGLLEERSHGWRGKILILILLGFVATDFVLTRLAVGFGRLDTLAGQPRVSGTRRMGGAESRKDPRRDFPNYFRGRSSTSGTSRSS